MKLELYHSEKYANVGPRLVAALLDSLLLGLPIWAGLYWLASQTTVSGLVTTFFLFLALVFFPVAVVQFCYFFISTAQWGKTIGKALVGLEVLDEKEQKLSYSRAFMRENVTKGVSAAVLGVGFWAVAFNPKHQAWHDEFAGSLVYRRENRTMLGVVAVVGLVALYALIGYNLFQMVSQSPLLEEIFLLLPQNFNV